MSKKVKFILIIVFIILVTAFIFLTKTMKLSSKLDFRKVYNSEQDMENIEIYIYDLMNHTETHITDRQDVAKIINMIKDEKITRKSSGLLGTALRLIIRNTANGNSVEVSIMNTQISINNRPYLIENELFNELEYLFPKYDARMI